MHTLVKESKDEREREREKKKEMEEDKNRERERGGKEIKKRGGVEGRRETEK